MRVQRPFLIVAASALLASGCHRPQVDLASVLDRHAAARGGKAAIEAVQAVEIELTIVEPGFTVEGLYRATRDGRMRVDILAGGKRVFTEAYDGTHGWQWPQGAAHGIDMSADGERAVRRGITGNLVGLHERSGQGETLVLRGRETVAGTSYWVIDATTTDGFEQRFYLDPRTWLVARKREQSALHPDVDAGKRQFEDLPSDYRSVAGVLFNFKSEKIALDTMQVAQTVTTRALRVNPVIDPAIFQRPE